MRSFCLILLIAILVGSAGSAPSQDPPSDDASRLDSTHYARQLSNGDAPTRQAAAEALARLAAIEQKKLVEGYVLQEKDKRVRLALNWALYRMGKSETLFQIVRDLDSPRHDQALDYLTQLDSPDPLYLFLTQQNTPPKVTMRVLQILGESGNAETVEKLKPFIDHYDAQVAAAAKVATEQIQTRLAQPTNDLKTRPRVVSGNKEPLR
jgi:HEAT repeat protein